MRRSHYRDQRHDGNSSLYHGIGLTMHGDLISSYQIFMSIVVIVLISEHFWAVQKSSTISTVNFQS